MLKMLLTRFAGRPGGDFLGKVVASDHVSGLKTAVVSGADQIIVYAKE